MSILDSTEFMQSLPKGQRIMGLDVGSKTVGIALSDVLHMIASPLETLWRKKFKTDIQRFQEIIKEHEIGGIVLGLPISMNGSEGPRCQSTRAFARNLFEATNLPMTLQDERMSTQAIERVLINDADMTRKRRGEIIDKLAAVYILQGFLDRIN